MVRKRSAPVVLASAHQASHKPSRQYTNYQDLLAAIEPTLRDDPNFACAFAALLCYIQELIKNGSEGTAHAKGVIESSIECIFKHTNEYKAEFEQYKRFLKGELSLRENLLSPTDSSISQGQAKPASPPAASPNFSQKKG